MKIEYVRSLQGSYMKIAIETPLGRTEEEMLSHNTVGGILPVRWQWEDNLYFLRYDITGKQALDVLLEQGRADDKLIQTILLGVCSVVKELERYLLEQEGILLHPETIFWDAKTERVYFCYCPEMEGTLQERFRSLMEYLLARTNHKNVDAVELAYSAYETLLQSDFRVGDMQDLLEMLVKKDVQIEKEVLQENEKAWIEIEQNSMEERRKSAQWKERFINKMAWIKTELQKKLTKRPVAKSVVFEPEEEEVKKGLPTVLLAENSKEIEGVLKYEGVHHLPDIPITKLPFIIGSDDSCDGQIHMPTISHRHAKLTKLDGVYFVEDLNSTNGTLVAGGLLTYKTKVSLKRNEQVCFANEPYIFL